VSQQETLVASLIERELRNLPERAKPDVILLDPEFWEKFVWEIQTSDQLHNTEVKNVWLNAYEKAKMRGIAPHNIAEIFCPDISLRFRRNDYIRGIRILYTSRRSA
jgi:hypothetical protein